MVARCANPACTGTATITATSEGRSGTAQVRVDPQPVSTVQVAPSTGTLVIGAGLAITGAAMLWILGPELLTQPWLMVALALYATNLVVAGFISRPNLRRLIGLRQSDTDDAAWRRRARQQRLVAYGMAGVIGVIGLLMSTKPELW